MESRQKLISHRIKGFEHVNRYWDPRMGIPAAKTLPRECYVSRTGEMIFTILGSCISVCIRDKKIGVGGHESFYASNTVRVFNKLTKKCGKFGSILWELGDGIFD
ncbi:MAG: chemotaxis receptor (MCP) glutamine deamidase CheD [Lentisphaeria bacterium]|jgi:chemotaxis receptor (MCP) glutamine deamidase CheD